MPEFTLRIGYKHTSSWSLRGWLAMRKSGAPFTEETVRYRLPDGKDRMARASPSGRVPVLLHAAGGKTLTIWDSLAICEYLAEFYPQLWPADRAARALARSVSAEMHSGFMALREHMSMDLFAHLPTVGHDQPGVAADIARIAQIWRQCREAYGESGGGPFLFGPFTIADVMYAPVCTRFRTYGVALDGICRGYMEAVLADPDFRAWEDAAREQGPPDGVA